MEFHLNTDESYLSLISELRQTTLAILASHIKPILLDNSIQPTKKQLLAVNEDQERSMLF